jgi:hypothetical protein
MTALSGAACIVQASVEKGERMRRQIWACGQSMNLPSMRAAMLLRQRYARRHGLRCVVQSSELPRLAQGGFELRIHPDQIA